MQASAEDQNILNASPAYIRAAAIISIALSLIGLSVSAYVYFALPHPNQVHHFGRGGEIIEPFAQYIFVYAAFQVLVALIVSVQALRWRSVLRRLADQEMSAKARNPRLQALDATVLYKLMNFFVCLAQTILLCAVLWRALMVVTNNI